MVTPVAREVTMINAITVSSVLAPAVTAMDAAAKPMIAALASCIPAYIPSTLLPTAVTAAMKRADKRRLIVDPFKPWLL
jgi:hypothetical protein